MKNWVEIGLIKYWKGKAQELSLPSNAGIF